MKFLTDTVLSELLACVTDNGSLDENSANGTREDGEVMDDNRRDIMLLVKEVAIRRDIEKAEVAKEIQKSDRTIKERIELAESLVKSGRTVSALEWDAFFGIRAAQVLAHETATDAGWYIDPVSGQPVTRNIGEVIALMHSELSEALEAARKSLMDDKLPHRKGIEVEFADCIIRILDTAAAEGLDLAGAIIEKNRFNRTRADHKLENRKAVGGKLF